MKSLSSKKLILIGFIAVLLVAIPITIFFLQQQQQTQTQAEQATTLSFDPTSTAESPITGQTGQPVSLNVVVDPGVNQNLVSFVRLDIQYDPAVLSPVDETEDVKPFQENTAALTLLEGPVITPGNISATLSVGVDPTKVIQTKTTIATLNFIAIAATEDIPTEVTFTASSQVLSAGSGDQANENVLSSRIPAYIAISGDEVPPDGEEPTATPSATITVTPTGTLTGSITPSPTGSLANSMPSCQAINASTNTVGTAPFTITLNALGTDNDGTITQATFSFGDGQVQNVTTGGGIGTDSVDVAATHTYEAAGSYQAAAVFTDDEAGVSGGNCTINITVNSASSSTTSGSSTTTTSTTTGTTTATDATLPDTGPGDLVIMAGILTSVVTIIGALLFFAL